MFDVREYIDVNGQSHFAKWFNRLNVQAAAKLSIALIRLENENLSNTKSVKGGVFEYRLEFGPGYRMYFGKDGSRLIVKKMPLTRDFKQTIKARAESDPTFREELLKEGVQAFLIGDLDTGKALLRDFINATLGFPELAELSDKTPESLMRMLGPKGNPRAKNLLEIIQVLQEHEGLQLRVRAVHAVA
jgi:putative addiction module killer protein